MTPDEIALTSPATLIDQFHISWSAGMARITFLESMQGQNPVARHAVAMGITQIAALRDALSQAIERIELQAMKPVNDEAA